MSIDKLDEFISDALKSQEIEIPCIDEVLFEFEKNVEKKAQRTKQSRKRQLVMAAVIVLCIGAPIMMNRFNANIKGENENPGTNIEKPSEGGSQSHGNPLSKYDSIEEAEKATGINIEEATWMVEGYNFSQVVVIDKGEEGIFVRQIFLGNNSKIDFEKLSEDLDIDSDHNAYEKVESIEIKDVGVEILKREDGTYKAIWNANGFRYSVIANPEVSKEEVIKIVEGLE